MAMLWHVAVILSLASGFWHHGRGRLFRAGRYESTRADRCPNEGRIGGRRVPSLSSNPAVRTASRPPDDSPYGSATLQRRRVPLDSPFALPGCTTVPSVRYLPSA